MEFIISIILACKVQSQPVIHKTDRALKVCLPVRNGAAWCAPTAVGATSKWPDDWHHRLIEVTVRRARPVAALMDDAFFFIVPR